MIVVDKAQGVKLNNIAGRAQYTAVMYGKVLFNFARPRFAIAIIEFLTLSKDNKHASNANQCSKSRA